ncbi:hypothetical protein F4678DRAFT_464945 [Xylaria arbuscula]|nr:hypothetical protein F4678DRAFT_464945 [Xylaria arbuscula]
MASVLTAFSCRVSSSTAQVTYPGVVELDVVFPRNDTYAPVHLLPIVFAIQNSPAAVDLALQLVWTINPHEGTDSDGDSGSISLTTPNNTDPFYAGSLTSATDSNTYYAIAYSSSTAAEGVYSLIWNLDVFNCSQDAPPTPAGFDPHGYIEFTLTNGTQQPNLVASTSPHNCHAIPNQVLNVTGTLTLQEDNLDDPFITCGVLGEPVPTGNPCASSLTEDQADNITALITSAWCRNGHQGAQVCEASAASLRLEPTMAGVIGFTALAASVFLLFNRH